MNDALLQIFLDKQGEYVSGEEISRKLQISRTAVWKQINRLRKKGYEFEAVSRLGYRYIGRPARLDPDALLARMNTKTMGRSIQLVETAASTQTLAQQLAAQGAPEGALVIAEEQTAGRGRMGRSWHSPSGKGIWMSLVLRPRISLQFTPQLTLLAAVAICRSLQKFIPAKVGIKWPNDLLVNGRKICGILLESSAEDERIRHVIAGIGISVNLTEADYPEELRAKATSLRIEAGRKIDRAEIILDIMREFETLYELYHEQGFAPIRTLWELNSVTLNRPITVRTANGSIDCVAKQLDETGALIVLNKDGERLKLFSGEIEMPN
ncbi:MULTISPECIES: biotin--[acetyl-CoA-carboxylase] ligase [unclassified Paenibacillus]|uniref:biotin--[acetyl-CoA-carboxylase] ligase n=1 Tax=unclassified Paenibacillus TaxID=185978 RepID=UPI001C0FDBC0|nr:MULTISPECIES: biotin--[acetyl-CoA-carboxylase] ligase [unclassified Paenibacillus]MBU5444003.1 biotin--[acetyl-CoA-carboxylase] ligase [Paenibacillus sp. MSJ-34]